jgi:heme-degrading monooxygenase HmoA
MYVVIFRSTRTLDNADLYEEWSDRMEQAVRTISGYQSHFGFRDVNSRQGVTISYFDSEDSISEWREFLEHRTAQALGREHFYEDYSVEVARIERRYEWKR